MRKLAVESLVAVWFAKLLCGLYSVLVGVVMLSKKHVTFAARGVTEDLSGKSLANFERFMDLYAVTKIVL